MQNKNEETNTNKQFPKLVEGTWKVWIPKMTGSLQKDGFMDWMDNFAPGARQEQIIEDVPAVNGEDDDDDDDEEVGDMGPEMLNAAAVVRAAALARNSEIRANYWRNLLTVERNNGGLSMHKYRKEMSKEQEAIGLVKQNVSEHLLKLIDQLKTLPDVLRELKRVTDIMNGAAIEAYSKLLWRIRMKDLKDAPQHVAKFEAILLELANNNSLPQADGIKRAFISSFKSILPLLAETLTLSKKNDFEACKRRLMDRAQDAIVSQMMEDPEEEPEPEPRSHWGENGRESSSRRRPREGMGIGRMDQLMQYESLQDVPHERLLTWENHRHADHKCQFQQKCWFRQPEAVPILRKFMDTPGVTKKLKTGQPSPFNTKR